MKNGTLLLTMLIVSLILPIVFLSVFERPSSRLNTVLKEVTLRVPGLESAYNWFKKLAAQGYVVEIRFINEPGYPYEVHGVKYGFSP